MRILGIDPGLTRCGLGVIEMSTTRRATFVHVEVVRTPSTDDLADRLFRIGTALGQTMDRFRPQAIALEQVFAQQNLHTVMGIAQISGVAFYLAAERNIPIMLHTPTQVKAAVTGYGAADKSQVGAMVAKILRLAEVPKPADAADALALAICHGWSGRSLAVSADSPALTSAIPQSAVSASAPLTPAQAAWRAAERRTKSSRNP